MHYDYAMQKSLVVSSQYDPSKKGTGLGMSKTVHKELIKYPKAPLIESYSYILKLFVYLTDTKK